MTIHDVKRRFSTILLRASYKRIVIRICFLALTSFCILQYGVTKRTTFKPEVRVTKEDACSNLKSGIPDIRPSYLPGLKNPCWYGNESQLNCLPYFFIAGQTKCGTTDLYRQVVKHPDIIARFKELHWFTRIRYKSMKEGVESLTTYIPFFKLAASVIADSGKLNGNDSITVDASPSTFWDNRRWWMLKENCGLKEPKYVTAHYVHHVLPQAKIIVIMRNPVDRIFSNYLFFQKEDNKTKDDFHIRVEHTINRFKSCRVTRSMRACAYNGNGVQPYKVELDVGLYDVFVDDWMKVFPKEQLHFIRFEDYTKDRLGHLKEIYQFLDIRPMSSALEARIEADKRVHNANTERQEATGPMRADTRVLLEEFYTPHNQRLANILDDKRFLWQE